MDNLQAVLDQIPVQHTFVSSLMLGGIIQGFLLCLVIAFRSKAVNHPFKIFAWFIFFLSLIGLDVYLSHTGLMKYCLWANNSTEVLVLLLGPTLYFFIWSILKKKEIQWRNQWMHAIVPILFLLTQIGYHLQPTAAKLNLFLRAYHPDILPIVLTPSKWLDFSIFFSKMYRYFLLGSILFYTYLCFQTILQHRKNIKNLFLDINTDKYGFSKNLIWLLLIAIGVIVLVFINFENDLGDYIIALFYTFCFYIISFFMLSESRFFKKQWLSDKYDTSGLKSNYQSIYRQILNHIEKEKAYLDKNCSLKSLATQLDLPANYVSQAIHQQSQQNFSDFINAYRVEEAKKRLGHPDYAHFNIAGIGETVGFKSKSAFYLAFKKHTNLTPTAFVKTKNG